MKKEYYSHLNVTNIVDNKAKGRISKRLFQENKARQIFRKTNIFYALIRTRREKNTRFEICSFALLQTIYQMINPASNTCPKLTIETLEQGVECVQC